MLEGRSTPMVTTCVLEELRSLGDRALGAAIIAKGWLWLAAVGWAIPHEIAGLVKRPYQGIMTANNPGKGGLISWGVGHLGGIYPLDSHDNVSNCSKDPVFKTTCPSFRVLQPTDVISLIFKLP